MFLGLAQVLLPPSVTEEDLKPAQLGERINPEVTQRLRRRPASEGTPTAEQEQRLASVDGTVDMERSSRDPRLPGTCMRLFVLGLLLDQKPQTQHLFIPLL